jgi:hypothetical protein
MISSKIRKKIRVFPLPHFIQYSPGISSPSNMMEERNKRNQVQLHVTTQVTPEIVRLSERSQTKKIADA